MPELVTHVLIALILAEFFHVRKKSIILLGAILPDVFAKIVLLRLFFPLPRIDYGFLSAFHTPYIFFLFSLVIAPLFRCRHRKIVWWLNLGGLSHIFADLLLRHFGNGGINLFYPLSLQGFRLNVVWPDQSYLLLYPLVVLYFFIVWYKEISPKEKRRET